MKPLGKESAWMRFAGVKNTELGVEMISMPTRKHPARKGTLLDIPGRDGKIFLDDGAYDSRLVSVQLMMTDDAHLDDVCAWLTGSGELVFGDAPQRAYRARVTKEFTRTYKNPRLRGQIFTVSFDCEPFQYESTPAATLNFTASGTQITNPGTADALPLIHVNGSGDGSLMIGGATMLFDGLVSNRPLCVDCEAKIVYTGEGSTSDPMILATQHATGEWIRIAPGVCFVTFTGGITSVAITPRWRWI